MMVVEPPVFNGKGRELNLPNKGLFDRANYIVAVCEQEITPDARRQRIAQLMAVRQLLSN